MPISRSRGTRLSKALNSDSGASATLKLRTPPPPSPPKTIMEPQCDPCRALFESLNEPCRSCTFQGHRASFRTLRGAPGLNKSLRGLGVAKATEEALHSPTSKPIVVLGRCCLGEASRPRLLDAGRL